MRAVISRLLAAIVFLLVAGSCSSTPPETVTSGPAPGTELTPVAPTPAPTATALPTATAAATPTPLPEPTAEPAEPAEPTAEPTAALIAEPTSDAPNTGVAEEAGAPSEPTVAPPPSPTLTPQPTSPPVDALPDAATMLERGRIFCVAGVPADDTLNVRSGPSVENQIVGELRPDSCGVRTLDVSDQGWVWISAFAAGGRELAVIQGWASSNFLVPVENVDSPEAVAMREGYVPTTDSGPAFLASPCVLGADQQAQCGVSRWFWQPGSSPCNETGVDRFTSDAFGTALLQQIEGPWTLIEQRVLAVQC